MYGPNPGPKEVLT